MQVVKRDGKLVDFDQSKIRVAIEKANREVRPRERATKEEINQIIDYDANSQNPTKVELISADEHTKLPRFGKIKPVREVLPIKPIKPIKR